jgi:hypothetical protein
MAAENERELKQKRMHRWRNVLCPESNPDAEIQAIDAFEESMGDLLPFVERIRALISRIDPLSHYKAFENIEFLLDAIGKLDYPRSPAVDVLWRFGQIDEDRRKEVKQYINALDNWLQDMGIEQAKQQQSDNTSVVDKVYDLLGESDDNKRWLAMCLKKTLKEHVYTPWDFINEIDDITFVRAVYKAILHRPPSPDDLQFRVEELRNGKDRQSFFLEIFDANEHHNSHLSKLADIIKKSG